MMLRLKSLLRKMIPGPLARRLYLWQTRRRWGRRRLQPVSRVFGLDRGTPIDRHYIERFLERHRADIAGRVLEIGDATYSRRLGGARCTQIDVLHAQPGNPQATVVGDLSSGQNIPHGAFDCIILTQTIGFIYEIKSAVANVHRALRPGGVVLATAGGISQISRYDRDRWGDFWRLTAQSAQRLFEEPFSREHVRVEAHGNVLAATAFLQGLCLEEMSEADLDFDDPDYPVVITIRAMRGLRDPELAR